MVKSILDIQKQFNLEIPRIIREIEKQKAKITLLQFPDLLKPYATAIAQEIEDKTNTNCIIWLGSCFGACDIPFQIHSLNLQIDLIIQFGHSAWPYNKENNIEVIE